MRLRSSGAPIAPRTCLERSCTSTPTIWRVQLRAKRGVEADGRSQMIYEVDPIYSAYTHDQPTLVERLAALDQLEEDRAKAGGEADETTPLIGT